MHITYKEIKQNERINQYMRKADESLIALGFTEHSFPHVTRVASAARRILLEFGYSSQEAELAKYRRLSSRYRKCGKPHRSRPERSSHGLPPSGHDGR